MINKVSSLEEDWAIEINDEVEIVIHFGGGKLILENITANQFNSLSEMFLQGARLLSIKNNNNLKQKANDLKINLDKLSEINKLLNEAKKELERLESNG